MTDFFDRAQSAIKNQDVTYDVDTTDRLKYVYTQWILFGTAFLIFAADYVGQPLQCWVPNQFRGGWEQYAEAYCLIEGTYFVNMNQTNLPSVKQREQNEMRYYQWVPFILAIQALVLYSPRALWKILQKVQDISLSTVTVATRNNAKKGMCDGIKCDLSPQDARKTWEWGNKLTFSLIGTKAISIVVIIIQTAVLEWFISGEFFSFFGVTVLVDMIRGRRWAESGAFPRVTFCDLEVREMGQVHRWSLQCVLMVNMFNEKIFVFIWWWFVMLIVVSTINLLKWIGRIGAGSQMSFLQRVIRCFSSSASVSDISAFRSKVLRMDGVTMLRLIEENATIYQASAYIEPLWEDFINEKIE